MKSISLCLLLALNSVAADDAWTSYKSRHGKRYRSVEEKARHQIFTQTDAQIVAHNEKFAAGLETYEKGHTKFSDMKLSERAAYLGFIPNSRKKQNPIYIAPEGDRALPASYDLRTSQCLPAIKDQGTCGDCWAFAAATPIEYQHCLKHNVSVVLSEQQITDCTYRQWDGCDGGYHGDAWTVIYRRGGLELESDYPFTSGLSGRATQCKFDRSKVVAKLANDGYVVKPDEAVIQKVLIMFGPITTAYSVTDDFYYYKSGVFSDPTCKNDYRSLNHEVVIVGYGQNGTTPYWIVRNHWGTKWGQDGYAFILRGNYTCGIGLDTGFPKVL